MTLSTGFKIFRHYTTWSYARRAFVLRHISLRPNYKTLNCRYSTFPATSSDIDATLRRAVGAPQPKPKPVEEAAGSSSSGSGTDAGGGAGGEGKGTEKGKPNRDHLQRMHNELVDSLHSFFAKPMNYKVYSPNLEFIDNIRGKRTLGLPHYVQQVAMLRMAGHVKFAYVRFHVLNTDISDEERRITIRWSIKGITGFQVFVKFWKYRLWNWKDIMDRANPWYEGVSYFDLGDDGLIWRHIADKVIEDKDREIDDLKPNKAALAAKLGVLTSLFPQSSLSCNNENNDSSKSCKTEPDQQRLRAQSK